MYINIFAAIIKNFQILKATSIGTNSCLKECYVSHPLCSLTQLGMSKTGEESQEPVELDAQPLKSKRSRILDKYVMEDTKSLSNTDFQRLLLLKQIRVFN